MSKYRLVLMGVVHPSFSLLSFYFVFYISVHDSYKFLCVLMSLFSYFHSSFLLIPLHFFHFFPSLTFLSFISFPNCLSYLSPIFIPINSSICLILFHFFCFLLLSYLLITSIPRFLLFVISLSFLSFYS